MFNLKLAPITREFSSLRRWSYVGRLAATHTAGHVCAYSCLFVHCISCWHQWRKQHRSPVTVTLHNAAALQGQLAHLKVLLLSID